MNPFEESQFCDEPARFTARLQALAASGASPANPVVVADSPPPAPVARPRRPGVDELCANYETDGAHSGHVARLALGLFDATHGWVGVPDQDRRLLEAAARLHDLAYAIDPNHHLERSAEITWQEGLAGFSVPERACVAAAILFHAGDWKTRLDHPIVRHASDRDRAMRVGAFLRIADGLDWAHIQDAQVVGATKARALLRVKVRSDWFPGNLVRADQKADLWRRVFPLDIRFVSAAPRRGRPIVEKSVPLLEAARRLLSVQYRIILADVAGAIAGEDPEPLHRIRVAIRRLRVLLRVFRKHLPDTKALDAMLASLGDALGAARDLDVWVAYLHGDEIKQALEGNRRWRAFLQHHEQLRGLQLPTVRRQLRGAHFNALRRRMAKLLRTQIPLLLSVGVPMKLEGFAAKRFGKEVRRVRELASLRRSESTAKRHRLRVALRRARYLGEFFGPVLGGGACRLTRRLHQAEKPLAQMHDLDTGLSLIEQSGPAAPRVLADVIQAQRGQQRSRIEPSWRRFVTLEKSTRCEWQNKPKQGNPGRRT